MTCDVCKDTGLFKWAPSLPTGVADFLYCVMPCKECIPHSFRISQAKFHEDVGLCPTSHAVSHKGLSAFLKEKGWNLNGSAGLSLSEPDKIVTITSTGAELYWKPFTASVTPEKPKPKPKKLALWDEERDCINSDYEYFYVNAREYGDRIAFYLVDKHGDAIDCPNLFSLVKRPEGYRIELNMSINENAPFDFDDKRQIRVRFN